jgi:hypothetical protein
LNTRFFFLAALLLTVLQAKAQTDHPATDTLQVVNWNIEWFGDASEHNSATQTAAVRSLMTAMNADVYALSEIVNRDSLASVVRSLPGGYDFVISTFGSFAPDPGSPEYASAQKLALVFRRSRVRNPQPRAMLASSSSAYYNFSSGRFPFQVNVEMLCRDSLWRPFSFMVLHAKAMTDGSSCNRRTMGCRELKDTLDRYFATTRFLLLGDFNDDLDVSNCGSSQPGNYAYLMDDSTHYVALTLPLSRAGGASTAGYSSMIDHVVASDEMAENYVSGSAEILKDFVTGIVPSYSSSVSDHYPVRTKYVLQPFAAAVALTASASAAPEIFPNPAQDWMMLRLSKGGEASVAVYDMQGRYLLQQKASGNSRLDLRSLPAGTYLIRVMAADGSCQRQRFSILR